VPLRSGEDRDEDALTLRLTLARLDRRLRSLQDAYYDAAGKDEEIIREYLRTLAEARRLDGRRSAETAAGAPAPRVHLGCGDHSLEGWLNVDFLRASAADLLADAARGLPFRDASVGFVHSEDLLEHLDLEGGTVLVRECFRVLRPGGVLRLLTPDLAAIIDRVYVRRDARHLAWCRAQLSTEDPCEALNMHLRMKGEHRFVYDEDRLRGLLERAGFQVIRAEYNRSAHRELRYLDLRDFGLNLFVEATKPAG
jgi:predicted SAM-dependent methyltransferase